MPDVAELPQDRAKRLERERRMRALLLAQESGDDRTLRSMASPTARPDASSTRRAEIALAVGGGEIPEEWVRDTRGETPIEAARRRERDRARRLENEGDAARAGTIQGVTLGFADEAEAAGRRMLGMERSDAPGEGQTRLRGLGHTPEEYAAERDTGSYEAERDRIRAENDRLQAESPNAYGAGEVLGSTLPALLIPAGGGAGATMRAAGSRILAAGGTGGLLGGASGLGHSRGDVATQALDTLRGTGYGVVTGMAGQALGEVGGAAARRMDAGRAFEPSPARRVFTPEEQAAIHTDPALRALSHERDQAIAEAASQRVQGTAGAGSTTTDVQRAADYPGGLERLADDIHEFGIVRPEDSALGIIPPSRDTAQMRARFLAEDSGARIGATEQRMNQALTDVPGPDPALVDLSGTARRLREQASQLRANLSPQSLARANELDDLAQRFEAAGRVPYGRRAPQDVDALGEFDLEAPLATPETTTTARRLLDDQRAQSGFGRRAPDANRPWAEEQARDVQRYLRQDMDAAMQRTLTPEEYAAHQLDRRQYGASTQVRELGGAADVRRRGNRQLPLSGTIDVAAEPTILGKAKAFVANRILRGREHAAMAMWNERQARLLGDDIAARLQARGQSRSALAIMASRSPQALGSALRQLAEYDPQAIDDIAASVQSVTPELIPEQDDELFAPAEGGESVPEYDPDLF